jgi:transmembrane sensor
MKIPFTDDKIAKYLSGEIDTKEFKEINDWADSETSNRKELEELSQLWNLKYSKQEPKKNDLIPDWNDLEINYLNKSKRSINIFLYSAAALILISFSLFKYLKDESTILFKSNESIRELVLSDNSKITLNYNSQISYSENFAINHREIFLDGEAFFQVSSNKNLPFIIHTKKSRTQVVGTEFNLKERADITHLTVTEGIVSFNRVGNKDSSISVLAGQESLILGSNLPTEPSESSENAINLSWMKKQLIFKDAFFYEIIDELNVIFKQDIRYDNDLREIKVTAVIKYDKPLKDILMNLSKSLELQLTFTNSKISFSK